MAWTTEKLSSDTYVMRASGSPTWAVIFVNSDYGCLSIQSDYGDYSYRWSHPGMEFKKFLLEIHAAQLIDKLSHGVKKFCEQESMNALRAYVDQLMQRYPDRKADLQYDFEEIESSGPSSGDAMYFMVAETSIAELMGDSDAYGEFIIKAPSQQLVAFVHNIWTEFREVLKKEISNG